MVSSCLQSREHLSEKWETLNRRSMPRARQTETHFEFDLTRSKPAEHLTTYVTSLETRIDLSRFGNPPHFNAAVTQQNGDEARSQHAGNNLAGDCG